MLMLRKIHLYLGALFAPTIVFFAFSGVLQTFGLHEAPRGDPHQPPAWIVTLASLHKDQQLSRSKGGKRNAASVQPGAGPAPVQPDAASASVPPGAAPASVQPGVASQAVQHDAVAAPGAAAGHDAQASPGKATKGSSLRQTILKIFVLLMGSGLIVSAMLGMVIALKNARTRSPALAMLALGIVLPVVLLL